MYNGIINVREMEHITVGGMNLEKTYAYVDAGNVSWYEPVCGDDGLRPDGGGNRSDRDGDFSGGSIGTGGNESARD